MTRTWEGPARQTGPNENATTKQPLGVEGNPTRQPVPLYRSPEWHALPAGDPRRLTSMRRAADAWWYDSRPDAIAARLADELATIDREVIRRIRATSYEVCTGADWQALAQQPTYAALADRRAEVPDGPCGSPRCRGCSRCIRADAVRRQGGDYRGRRRNRGAA
ncbi:MAG TPA: hypothetical protein VIS06_18210 [Mycobacteriales bacterium]